MAIETPQETMDRFNASGGISSNLSPDEVRDSVANDIAMEESKNATTTTGATQELSETSNDTSKVRTEQSATESGTVAQVRNAAQTASKATQASLEQASRIAGSAQDKVARQVTPGGIIAMVAILLLLVFVLVPVDATKMYSRVQLLLLSLMGGTRLIGHRTPQIQSTSATTDNTTSAIVQESTPYTGIVETATEFDVGYWSSQLGT